MFSWAPEDASLVWSLVFCPCFRIKKKCLFTFNCLKLLFNLADIATIQPSLQAHLVPLGAQSIIIHAKTLPNPWRQSTFSKSLKFYAGHLRVPRGRLLITAVATVETKYPAQTEHQQSSSLSSSDASKPSDGRNGGSDDGEEVDDRERLRRMRISKANRGNTPWNKGRKHSPGG